MKFFQSTFLSSISTLSKILTGIISLKIIALYTGPEGVAVLGQFTTLVNMLSVIAGGGIGLGVTKYVAEYATKATALRSLLNTAAACTLFFSMIILLFGVIFSHQISIKAFSTPHYAYLIRWMSFGQIFIAVNLLICSIMTGIGKLHFLVLTNVINCLLSVLLIGLAAHFKQIDGVLIAWMLSQCLAMIVSLALVYKEQWMNYLFSLRLKTNYLNKLLHFSLMSITSTLALSLSQIAVRNDLSTLFNWNSVGYWQAVLRLSDSYILFITMAFTSFYLPALSQLTDTKSLKAVIWRMYKLLIPMVAFGLILIYLLRHIILFLLYSEDFQAAGNLFLYQLIGDFFRISGWLFTYFLLAKTWTKVYITSEILLGVVFVVISHVCARLFGLIGVTYAFALTYFVYWLFMACLALYILRIKPHAS